MKPGPFVGADGAFARPPAADERAPLLEHEQWTPLAAVRRAGPIAGELLAAFGPTAALVEVMFVVPLLLTSFAYHGARAVVTVLDTALCAICLVGFAASVRLGARDRAPVFALCGVAALSGAASGLYNYVVHVRHYSTFFERRHYAEVFADEKAAAHRDAAVLAFHDGSRPDLRFAASYGSGRGARCAAPITAGAEAAAGFEVQFWAVGTGCCDGGAFSCGDARDPAAHTGVVLQNRSSDLPRMLAGLVSGDLDGYMTAVRMSCAAFGLSSARPPLLVHWVEDPWGLRRSYISQARGFCLLAGLVTLPIWFLLSIDSAGLRNFAKSSRSAQWCHARL